MVMDWFLWGQQYLFSKVIKSHVTSCLVDFFPRFLSHHTFLKCLEKTFKYQDSSKKLWWSLVNPSPFFKVWQRNVNWQWKKDFRFIYSTFRLAFFLFCSWKRPTFRETIFPSTNDLFLVIRLTMIRHVSQVCVSWFNKKPKNASATPFPTHCTTIEFFVSFLPRNAFSLS